MEHTFSNHRDSYLERKEPGPIVLPHALLTTPLAAVDVRLGRKRRRRMEGENFSSKSGHIRLHYPSARIGEQAVSCLSFLCTDM
jgi:hypothetical protein